MILSDIFIYPVKSLAGIRVSNWDVVATGLKYDRQWMLIDEHGQFLSQRRLPKMALIQTQLTNSELILSAENFADLYLPLESTGGAIIPSTVWGDCCNAWHVSNAADIWFSDVLQTQCQLVYFPPEEIRLVDETYANETDRTAFSDGFPFLIISENSLNALNAELETPVEMARFRPNLVISDCAAYAEDSWQEIQIGNIDFRLPKPCSRCSVPAINPNTGKLEKEPLKTLARLRKLHHRIFFGQNALHDACGKLKIGDEVTVKTFGEDLDFSAWKIEYHWLAEAIAGAEPIYSDNCNDRPDENDISLVVIHSISLPPNEFGGEYIADLFCNRLNPDAHPYFQAIQTLQVSAHLLIYRDGTCVQFVPFDKRAWHAGKSNFQGRENCNDFSIGIELEGCETIPYTDAQYEKLNTVLAVLFEHYPSLKHVTGHCDIAPERKTDPGASFDWSKIYQGKSEPS